MISDIAALMRFISSGDLDHALMQLGSNQRCDTRRIVVAGSSAGALLAFQSVYHALPGNIRPTGVLGIYGLGGASFVSFH